jgi:hypothetical protein
MSSLKSDIPLLYPPNIIAIAALRFAIKELRDLHVFSEDVIGDIYIQELHTSDPSELLNKIDEGVAEGAVEMDKKTMKPIMKKLNEFKAEVARQLQLANNSSFKRKREEGVGDIKEAKRIKKVRLESLFVGGNYSIYLFICVSS